MIRIVIASVLKPIDEVRMYKRFAISLAGTSKYEVNIIGIESKNQNPCHPNIHFHRLPQDRRGVTGRLHNLRIYRRYIRKINPRFIIVTSPDLLAITTLTLPKSGTQIIYDLQEDYYKNIIFQRVYPGIIRWPLAVCVRMIENLCSRQIHHLILAERIYQKDIPLVRKCKQVTILENKLAGPLPAGQKKNSSKLQLLFSGTISHYAGIDHALSVYHSIRSTGQHVVLRICGICHDDRLRAKLQKYADQDKDIHLTGIHSFVSHDTILDHIRQADIGIIGYTPNPVNRNKMPSKLYEYLAMNLITIVYPHELWVNPLDQSHLAIVTTFDQLSGQEILRQYQLLRKKRVAQANSIAYWGPNETHALIQIFS